MNSDKFNSSFIEKAGEIKFIGEQNQPTAPTAPADPVECRQGLNEPSTDKPLHDADWEEDYKCAVVYGEEESEPVYLLERGGIGCLPLGDIVMVKGQKKNGKSMFLSIVVAAMLKGDCIGFKRRRQINKLMYFDCEQRRPNAAKQNVRVYELVGDLLKNDNKDWKHFAVFSLRGKKREWRKAFVERRILAESPDVVVIDGIRDLMKNKNDTDESAEIVDWMMNLSERDDGGCTTFICVLHENPTSDTGKMTGTIGTEMGNMMSEAYRVKHTSTKGVFEVSMGDDDCRTLSIEKFAFMLDSNAIPVSADSAIEVARRQKEDSTYKAVCDVFIDEGVTELSKTELDELVGNKLGVCGKSARDLIKPLIECGRIPITKRGKSIICTISGKVENTGKYR